MADPVSTLNHGAAFFFDLESGSIVGTLVSPMSRACGAFGGAVALAGADALVADFAAGAVHLFDGETGAVLRTFVGPPRDPAFGRRAIAALGPDPLVAGNRAVYLLDAASGSVRHTFRRIRLRPAYWFPASPCGPAADAVLENVDRGAFEIPFRLDRAGTALRTLATTR
jgi:hypothetical protein